MSLNFLILEIYLGLYHAIMVKYLLILHVLSQLRDNYHVMTVKYLLRTFFAVLPCVIFPLVGIFPNGQFSFTVKFPSLKFSTVIQYDLHGSAIYINPRFRPYPYVLQLQCAAMMAKCP